jgi:hypothetical protein
MANLSAPDWSTFTRENPTFTALYHKALMMIPTVLETPPPENDSAGMVIQQLMAASVPDFGDIMILASNDAHWGAWKLLRCAFERTVTLKYIAQNPEEAQAFVEYDAITWKSVQAGIEGDFGLRLSVDAQKNLDQAVLEAREKFRQERCPECKMRKRTSWTPHSVQELAKRTGMDYMFFEAFEMPSKFIHPTYFGTYSITGAAPVHNTLKHTHENLLETILAHERYFRGAAPMSELVVAALEDFMRVWKFAKTDFGMPDRFSNVMR